MNLKLGLLLFSIAFSRRIQENHIRTICVAPGTFRSNLVREFRVVKFLKNLISISTHVAARRVANLVTNDIPNKSLLFFWVKKFIEPTQYWQNAEIHQIIWKFTQKFVNLETFSINQEKVIISLEEDQYENHARFLILLLRRIKRKSDLLRSE